MSWINSALNSFDNWATNAGQSIIRSMPTLANRTNKFFNNYLSGQSDLEAQKAASLELQQQAQGFNSAEAVKDREWQEYMASTAIQRQAKDLEAAGLNPWLALNGGMSGASVGSGAQASSSAGSVGQRTHKVSELINAASTLFNGGKSTYQSLTSSALRVAGLALMALL